MTANKQKGKQLTDLARRVLVDKHASAAAKAVAASALTQRDSAASTPSKKIAASAAEVLRDKRSNSTEKAIAASALVVRPRFKIKGRTSRDIEKALETVLEKRKA